MKHIVWIAYSWYLILVAVAWLVIPLMFYKDPENRLVASFLITFTAFFICFAAGAYNLWYRRPTHTIRMLLNVVAAPLAVLAAIAAVFLLYAAFWVVPPVNT